MYRVMTLRKLPPEGIFWEFNADIAVGRRPKFLPEVNTVVLQFFHIITIFCIPYSVGSKLSTFVNRVCTKLLGTGMHTTTNCSNDKRLFQVP